MKLSFIPLLALLSVIPAAMALPATPTAEPPAPTIWSGTSAETVSPHELTKRDVSATVKVDGLRYRTCPRTTTGCPAKGQYPINTHIYLQCYTRENTSQVNGDWGWAKVSNGYWVAISWGQYVSWSGSLHYC